VDVRVPVEQFAMLRFPQSAGRFRVEYERFSRQQCLKNANWLLRAS
jgi:hypothetical protein